MANYRHLSDSERRIQARLPAELHRQLGAVAAVRQLSFTVFTRLLFDHAQRRARQTGYVPDEEEFDDRPVGIRIKCTMRVSSDLHTWMRERAFDARYSLNSVIVMTLRDELVVLPPPAVPARQKIGQRYAQHRHAAGSSERS